MEESGKIDRSNLHRLVQSLFKASDNHCLKQVISTLTSYGIASQNSFLCFLWRFEEVKLPLHIHGSSTCSFDYLFQLYSLCSHSMNYLFVIAAYVLLFLGLTGSFLTTKWKLEEFAGTHSSKAEG